MKRYILALTVIVISLVMNAQDSDILMTLGKNKVTKDDFEYLFLKNRTNVKTKPPKHSATIHSVRFAKSWILTATRWQ